MFIYGNEWVLAELCNKCMLYYLIIGTYSLMILGLYIH